MPLTSSERVRRRAQDAPVTFALALAASAVALVLRYLLIPWIGHQLPFITVFGAVAAVSWLGGHRPGLVVVVLSYVGCGYMMADPPWTRFGFAELGGAVGLLAYLFTCGLILFFGQAARVAHVRDREKREMLHVTLRSIGDAVITTDVKGRVASMNAVAESLTGWTEADAVGQPLDAVFRIVNETTRRQVDNPATRALREGASVGLANHTILIRKDGTERPIDDSAAPIRDDDGAVSGCVLVFRDVTERRRFEQEQADQLTAARLLASIIESSDDAIVSKSLDGTIRSWNAGAERLFGYPAAEAIGRHISLVIPSERLAEEDGILTSLAAGKRIEHFETERVHKDGRRLLVSLTISPIKNDRGEVVGASKIGRDVTERKRLEDNLRRLAADLSAADRRKNDFLAMLAHELRNPLAPISNAAHALRLGASDGQVIRAASALLERQVGQMSRLVDDLLDMSRITQGKVELRKERVELAPVMEQAVEMVRWMCDALNHELTISLPPAPVYVEADPARLAQIVGNLLNNACKFTDRDGRVWLTVTREDEQVVIRVRDSGIGVAAEQLPHLFELFSQVDTSLERSRDGLGIGLTLVKSLVEMHGGTVAVHSDGPGRGAEFTVRLPIVVEAPAPAEHVAVAPPAPERRRVLIVDDSEDGAQSLAMLLEIYGHETHVVHDGFRAIEAVEQRRPDVILLDIGLPGLNGYEVCKRIRKSSLGKDIMIVALTGWGQDQDRERSREAGFDAHLVKPARHDDLIRLLAPTSSTTSS